MLQTKYPILLVHGMGIRDGRRGAWGRIPQVLTENGCQIFYGGQDANGLICDNARVLKERVMQIVAETGCEKVNILAHSRGGVDARYMIARLEMAEYVASLSTFGTPHNGSKTLDWLFGWPRPALRGVCAVADVIMRMAGDTHPRTYELLKCFTTSQARLFNESTPDAEGVYYQSFAFVLKGAFSDPLSVLPYLIIKRMEGENDGLLTPAGVRWTNFRGVFTGNSYRGIAHRDETDFHRRAFTRKEGKMISDMPQFYVDVVRELKERGL